eukprot:CAMPEP_0117426124 /NCGR_PEP_ID=MMETSP0758-20121206/6289_1 /TAXON_ID=63605 /ORGANISM="Percolomonas cosmopolitus, Strain AE-1 (ATCC 50343)" /LENGTH=144 /DNA_ID=CAMNT_0005211081 /DNA_START=180 /DNA_END=614 /DNA_ORIENTATION=-
MAMTLPIPEGVDRIKCMKMALVHDLAEAIVGDITPHDNVSEDDKHQREKDAFETLIAHVTDKKIGEEMYDLWQQYEKQESKESNVVKELDKFDMMLQALEYEETQQKDLNSFFKSSINILKSPAIKQLGDHVYQQHLNLHNKKA